MNLVTVWHWPLALSEAEHDVLSALLSGDERARAERFVAARDRTAFVAARGGMRLLLARALRVEPEHVAFSYGKAGKPELAPQTGRPHFNLTHSGGHAALAICADAAVGIDIELMRPIERDLAGRFFSKNENAELDALSQAQWSNGFFRCWTRKEAIVKALGTGLGHDTRTFDVSTASEPPYAVRNISAADHTDADWRILEFKPSESFQGSVALQTLARDVRLSSSAVAIADLIAR